MKYTPISSEMAYKYHKAGKGNMLYFQSFTAPFEPIQISYLEDLPLTRAMFRSQIMFIGIGEVKKEEKVEKTYTLQELKTLLGINSYVDSIFAYSKALKTLKEEPKKNWNEVDMIDAIIRSLKS